MCQCPVWSEEKNDSVCPECGGELDKESESEDVAQYCGLGCSACGWEHCGGCI